MLSASGSKLGAHRSCLSTAGHVGVGARAMPDTQSCSRLHIEGLNPVPTGTEGHFSTALLHNCDSHNACIHLNAATKGRGHHSDHSHLPGDWRRWVLDIAKSKPSNKLLGMAEVGQASKGVGWPFTGSPEILH